MNGRKSNAYSYYNSRENFQSESGPSVMRWQNATMDRRAFWADALVWRRWCNTKANASSRRQGRKSVRKPYQFLSHHINHHILLLLSTNPHRNLSELSCNLSSLSIALSSICRNAHKSDCLHLRIAE